MLLLSAGIAAGAGVTLNLSTAASNSINASGGTEPDGWVSLKVLDSSQSIVFFDAVKADTNGQYSCLITLSDVPAGRLEVVAGSGENVARKGVTVSATGSMTVDTSAISAPVSTVTSGGAGSASSAGSTSSSSSGASSSTSGGTTSQTPVSSAGTASGGVATPVINNNAGAKTIASLKDVPGNWAAGSINKLVSLGAIGGYPDGSFQPDARITRAEFATVLVKAFKLGVQNGRTYSDTSDHWASKYIATASAQGIVSGYSEGTFGPDDFITREQMAIMIVKAGKLTPAQGGKAFADQAKISSWAAEAIATASSRNIISGYTDSTFRPQSNATRGEAVTVIAKAL